MPHKNRYSISLFLIAGVACIAYFSDKATTQADFNGNRDEYDRPVMGVVNNATTPTLACMDYECAGVKKTACLTQPSPKGFIIDKAIVTLYYNDICRVSWISTNYVNLKLISILCGGIMPSAFAALVILKLFGYLQPKTVPVVVQPEVAEELAPMEPLPPYQPVESV